MVFSARKKYRSTIFFVVVNITIVFGQTDIKSIENKIQELENSGKKIELADLHNKLGNLYWQKSELDKAATHFSTALLMNEELDNQNAVRIINGYLGLIYLEAEKYDLAIKYFNNSLKLNKKKNKQEEVVSDYYNIATAYQLLNDYSNSNKNADKALALALELDNLEMSKSCNLLLAENYEKLGEEKKAAEHFTNYNALVKHLQSKQVKQLESEKKKIENQIFKKSKELESALDTLNEVVQDKTEIEKQKEKIEAISRIQKREFAIKEKLRRTQLLFAAFILILLASLLFLFFIQNRSRKRANKKLQEQNKEIEEQKIEIEKQRDFAHKQRENLTSSIQYARRIQSAVVPKPTELYNYFIDSFISYHPKDIVSGDFYWFTQKENLFVIAAADCTGHGVPGAFMSMLGVAYLNEIINKIAINIHISALNADDILNQLREKVITSLHQSDNRNEPKDGMDIALCIIDTERKKLQFAGAYNPLLIIRGEEIIELKGDKMPVSYHKRKDVAFTKQTAELKNGDCLYLFSDGYVDQFGGEKKHKYLLSRFKENLVRIHQKPMLEQKNILEEEFAKWKGNLNQVDDVLVIGFRFGKPTIPGVKDWSDKTILIAEDTDINYYLMAEVLNKTKAKLARVNDGVEALEFVKGNKVDLILMDINMPNMNGYEATKLIKEYKKDIPIIIQTALYDEDLNRAKEAGADEFISKPIDLKTFMKKISKFI